MAANPTGGPVFNPGLPRRATNPLNTIREAAGLSTGGAPHEGDHGRGLFNHPSTNRAETGLLNGAPVRNPGLPTRAAAGGSFEPSNTLGPRRVDITMPPNISGGNESAPHRRPGRNESGSSRAARQGRRDLGGHNRSGA